MLAAPGVFTRYHIPHSQAVSLIPQLFDNENNKVDETQTWLTVVRCSQGKCFICPNLTVVLSGTKSGLSKSYATELTRIFVHVFAIGELSESAHVFVDMELCAFNLKEYNKSNWTYGVADGPDIIADRIWRIMQQIARGLVFIHSKGEVHRDIKPQNGRTILNK